MASVTPQGEVSGRRERLEYLADLVSELQALAAKEHGCAMLSGFLALALAEARRQAQMAPS